MKKKNIIIILIIIAILMLGRAVWSFIDNKNAIYEIKISVIDDYSPDRKIIVLKNGRKISFDYIRYNLESDNEIILCYGNNPTINYNDVSGQSNLIVVLKNEQEIVAKIIE